MAGEKEAIQSVQVFGRKKTATAVAYCKRGHGLIKVSYNLWDSEYRLLDYSHFFGDEVSAFILGRLLNSCEQFAFPRMP